MLFSVRAVIRRVSPNADYLDPGHVSHVTSEDEAWNNRAKKGKVQPRVLTVEDILLPSFVDRDNPRDLGKSNP